MLVKSSKLSDFKVKKLVWCFCVDVETSKVGLITGLNRNTVNRFYHIFRSVIWLHQQREFDRLMQGEAECDEAYFGGKRLRGVAGKKGRGTHLRHSRTEMATTLMALKTFGRSPKVDLLNSEALK